VLDEGASDVRGYQAHIDKATKIRILIVKLFHTYILSET
jgi:hypothetical protein